MQETGQDISNQVFNGCGKPQLGQRRRRRSISPKFLLTEPKYFDEINTNSRPIDSAAVEDIDNFSFVEDDGSNGSNSVSANSDDDKSMPIPLNEILRSKRNAVPPSSDSPSQRELHFQPFKFDGDSEEDLSADDATVPNQNGRKRNKNGSGNRGGNGMQRNRNDDDNEKNDESPLDKLVKDIRQKVKDTKKFWSNLPFQICNNEEVAASPTSDANCWNGNAVDR